MLHGGVEAISDQYTAHRRVFVIRGAIVMRWSSAVPARAAAAFGEVSKKGFEGA